jgi:F-type H+-transporting ATPase subunit b
MLFDWFTVSAQVINFLFLVWLLRRYLYKPILKAIDAREDRIASELSDAATKQAEAKSERENFRKKNEDFDLQREELLAKATSEADTKKKRLLIEAREAADDMSSKRLEALHNDAKNLNQAITLRAQDEVFSIARKVLTDLADVDLEERTSAIFINLLRAMDSETEADLGHALKTSNEPALVRSAFELPDELRTNIQNAINETFSADINLKFETTPKLVSGIELTASGSKIAWSISDYLTSLEKGVDELIKTKPESRP